MNIKNTGNSCYLDSLIVAMYGYNDSPFLKFLNDETPIRRSLKTCLNNNNSSQVVRSVLPKKFGRSQQDPGETYNIILNDFKYDPMTITKIRQVKKVNSEKIYKKKSTKENSCCFTIDNTGKDTTFDEIKNPLWEILSDENLIHDSKNNPVYNRTRNLIFFTKADCLIFYFNRCQNVIQKFTNKLEMPWNLESNNNKYFCFAVIVHIGKYTLGGHYITVLYDGYNNYYVYDDMSVPTTSKLTYNNKIKEFIERNGVMYFYYTI